MNKSVVIVGASGHGKVVADIVLKNKDNIVGFLDDNTELAESFAGFPVLGTTDQYQKYSDACFVIAIGNAAVREKLVDKLKNVSWYTAIHPTAVISELDVSDMQCSCFCYFSEKTRHLWCFNWNNLFIFDKRHYVHSICE